MDSKALFAKAQTLMPGGVNSPLRAQPDQPDRRRLLRLVRREHDPDRRVDLERVQRVVVITSYSIHYTKLYEIALPAEREDQETTALA